MLGNMLWGVPLWIWAMFLIVKVLKLTIAGALWIHFYSKVMWNDEIEKKYYGDMLKDTQTEKVEMEGVEAVAAVKAVAAES